MCSQFQVHGMENYQGDLADIVRGSGGGGGGGLAGNATREASPPAVPDTWQYSGSNDNDASNSSMATVMNYYSSDHHDFGDSFCSMIDPLKFQELAMPTPSATFFACSDNDLDLDLVDLTTTTVAEAGTSTSVFAPPKLVHDEEMKKPACNIFSRMLQNSDLPQFKSQPPPPPPPAAAGGGLACSENMISATSSATAAGLQISSPGNTGSIKRRSTLLISLR